MAKATPLGCQGSSCPSRVGEGVEASVDADAWLKCSLGVRALARCITLSLGPQNVFDKVDRNIDLDRAEHYRNNQNLFEHVMHDGLNLICDRDLMHDAMMVM